MPRSPKVPVLFGGSTGPPFHRPRGTRLIWPDSAGLWLSDRIPSQQVGTARAAGRCVAIVGLSAITTPEIVRLAEKGVSDNVAAAWPGSYCVIEATSHHTRIWTDVCGARPIYLRQHNGETLWASSSRLLASLDNRPPDLQLIARRLVLAEPHTPAGELLRTHFAEVQQVPGGHRLTLWPDGWSELCRVWHPRPQDGDHAQRLHAALDAAVATRIDSAVTTSVDLSGGFDSTALALLAAERSSRFHPVTAVTVHPKGVHAGGDLDYAREAATHLAIRHEWLALGTEHSPFQVLPLPVTDEPPPSATTYAVFAAQLTHLAGLGCESHMTGDGGDSLLTTPVSIIRSLVRRGHWLRALQEVALSARLRRTSWTTTWRAAGSSRPLDDILAGLMEVGRSSYADVQIAQTFGVELHNPYTDAHVADAYLSVPEEDLPSPSLYKPVLAQAMSDLFPPRLRKRTTKGTWSIDHHRGLRLRLGSIRNLMDDGYLHGHGLIDIQWFHEALRHAAIGMNEPMAQIERAVATEMWFRALNAAPTPEWIIDMSEVNT